MVYIHAWQDYQDAAEALYAKSPTTTRYCVKWKSSEGKLVLKITDNTTCIKFKTYSSIFLNRFEALNLSLMEKMQNRRKVEAPAAPDVVMAAPSPAPPDAAPAASSAVPSTSGAPAAGGVKKKKPKKKK
ncbi:signal recognition particle, SRP9/SRP14 subunit [Mycena metata]|uniref:Signal recognition particle, SRP9/SRP14 subunit n=1 Tax=Mycena metata TaxID=1033252 RepID=A0AAD7N711_9AGAR|nr:signal recognition particle, SRP9/SRP14 subunit [Mycena metata]KAJ7748608.1 signal recognition particle, SRP9/SRP14 subunit [Mycena metata]